MEEKTEYHVGDAGGSPAVGALAELITPEEHVRLEEAWVTWSRVCRAGEVWAHATVLQAARLVYGYDYGFEVVS